MSRLKAFLLMASLCVPLGLSAPATAGRFDTSPHVYGAFINRALEEVGSDLRFSLQGCRRANSVECLFTSARVKAVVAGRITPPFTERISIEVDLLRDEPGADPISMVADVALALGATIVVFDPRALSDRRVQVLDLIRTALDTGTSALEGVEALFAAAFDQAASGTLVVVVIPKGAWAKPSAIGRLARGERRVQA
jgi:hypothetical protein